MNVPVQAKGHAETQEKTLVGYYQACERLDDIALAPVGERVAQKIRDQFNDAVAFVVSILIVTCTTEKLMKCHRLQIDGDKLGTGDPALIVCSLTLIHPRIAV
jgi:guanine deaminase